MKLKFFLIACLFFPSLCFAKINSVSVIGPDTDSFNSSYYKSVTQLANNIANQKKSIYCIGASTGLAGTFLKTAFDKKAEITAISYQEGVIKICQRNQSCQETETTLADNLNEQTFELLSKGDGVVFLPGGFDVLYAFNYLQTLINNNQLLAKPVVFLNTNHYWDRLKEMLTEMKRQNVIPQTTLDRIAFENKPENVVKTLEKIERKIIKK